MGRRSAPRPCRDHRRAGEVFGLARSQRGARIAPGRRQRARAPGDARDAGGSNPQALRRRNPGARSYTAIISRAPRHGSQLVSAQMKPLAAAESVPARTEQPARIAVDIRLAAALTIAAAAWLYC